MNAFRLFQPHSTRPAADLRAVRLTAAELAALGHLGAGTTNLMASREDGLSYDHCQRVCRAALDRVRTETDDRIMHMAGLLHHLYLSGMLQPAETGIAHTLSAQERTIVDLIIAGVPIRALHEHLGTSKEAARVVYRRLKETTGSANRLHLVGRAHALGVFRSSHPRNLMHPPPLCPDALRVAEELVTGALNPAIADMLGMSLAEVTGHLDRIGQLTCARARHTRAHQLLASGLVAPPPASRPLPVFSSAEKRLLSTLRSCELWQSIATSAGLSLSSVKPAMQSLIFRAGADNRTHLVGLAHAWDLFDHPPSARATPGVSPP
ncbi:helix-turn-helix transcriptional regulator [Streptomyces sp. NPDC002221]|uniref:helix-turn-helix transcriptional regulator n=1 Tax=Streptomyces sp. NPDC002221 TaxID=3364639 RepID=UPI0036765CAE